MSMVPKSISRGLLPVFIFLHQRPYIRLHIQQIPRRARMKKPTSRSGHARRPVRNAACACAIGSRTERTLATSSLNRPFPADAMLLRHAKARLWVEHSLYRVVEDQRRWSGVSCRPCCSLSPHEQGRRSVPVFTRSA